MSRSDKGHETCADTERSPPATPVARHGGARVLRRIQDEGQRARARRVKEEFYRAKEKSAEKSSGAVAHVRLKESLGAATPEERAAAARAMSAKRWAVERSGGYTVRTVVELVWPGEEPGFLADELTRLAKMGFLVGAPRRVRTRRKS